MSLAVTRMCPLLRDSAGVPSQCLGLRCAWFRGNSETNPSSACAVTILAGEMITANRIAILGPDQFRVKEEEEQKSREEAERMERIGDMMVRARLQEQEEDERKRKDDGGGGHVAQG